MDALEAVDLVKDYPVPRGLRDLVRAPFDRRRKRALDGATLSVSPGERMGLVGKNGAGKSTLARIFTGVVLPDSGAARIGGQTAGFEGAARRLVGLARPDDPALHPRLSVVESLRFHAALHGVDGALVRDVLDRVGGGSIATQRAQTLSSGERAKASLAKALLPSPRVLILDELSRVLDPGAAKRIRELLDGFAAAGGAVLLITHDLLEAAQCDRVALLEDGKVSAVGAWPSIAARVGEVFGL
jgi:ABC-2 type transport system ATP-binding protein